MVTGEDGEEVDTGLVSGGPRVRVIERAFDILEQLAEQPKTLSEIAVQTGLSKATVFRLLSGLAHRGVVAKDPLSGRHMLGPGLLPLVSGAVSGLASTASIAGLSRNVLDRLAAATGETVAIHAQVGLGRVCVSEVPSPQAIRFTSTVGSSAPLTVGAAGKVLLAFADPAEQDRLVPLLAAPPEDIALRDLLAKIREQGFATSVGERGTGVSAVSVPVRTAHLLLALSVLGPTSRLPGNTLLSFVEPLRDAAEQVRGVAEHAGASAR